MTGFIYCCGGLAGGLLGVVDVDDVLPKLLEVFVPEFPKLPKPLLAAPCCPNPLLDGFCAPLKPPPKLPKLEEEPGPVCIRRLAVSSRLSAANLRQGACRCFHGVLGGIVMKLPQGIFLLIVHGFDTVAFRFAGHPRDSYSAAALYDS